MAYSVASSIDLDEFHCKTMQESFVINRVLDALWRLSILIEGEYKEGMFTSWSARNLRINHSDISIDRRQEEGGRGTTIKAQH